MNSHILKILAIVGLLFHVTSAGICGDGKIDPGDICDDGNTLAGDGCAEDCTQVEDGYSCNHLYDDPEKHSICCKEDELHENPHRNTRTENFCGPCRDKLHESKLYHVTEGCKRIDVNECATARRCSSTNFLCLNRDATNPSAINPTDVGYECKCIYGGVWSLACDGFRYVVSGRYIVSFENDNITATIKTRIEEFFNSHILTMTEDKGDFQISVSTDTNSRRLLSPTDTLVSVIVDFSRIKRGKPASIHSWAH